VLPKLETVLFVSGEAARQKAAQADVGHRPSGLTPRMPPLTNPKGRALFGKGRVSGLGGSPTTACNRFLPLPKIALAEPLPV
jgi:hypothetical protein